MLERVDEVFEEARAGEGRAGEARGDEAALGEEPRRRRPLQELPSRQLACKCMKSGTLRTCMTAKPSSRPS